MKYTCINIQGNLISEEILQKVELAEIQGQSPIDFDLEPGGNLRGEIEYAWSRIKLDWKQFSDKSKQLPSSDPYGTTVARRWMKNFFSSLGFELRDQKTSLQGSNNQSYSISHTAENLDDLPVHIVGFHEPAHPDRNTLDIKASGGTSKYSPHGTMQEYLNVTDHLFGIVTNGMLLRLMRDSGRLIKLTYVEFDLKRMLDEDRYSEFTLLYRLLHASRFPFNKEEREQCLLEKYYLESIETGNRIRDGLSKAVKESLLALGTGFLQHEANTELLKKLRTGTITPKDYYRQLLRVIYRLLFLMVTEERDLVYDPEDKGDDVLHLKKIYWDFYSIARLRKQSEKQYLYETQFSDIWQGLINTFRLFEAEGNGIKLGISPLDGDLFSYNAIADLQDCHISNKLMLECIRNLNEFTDINKNLVPINYRSLDVEELGSVYEGLLELHPVIVNLEAVISSQIAFIFQEGTDRKTTGSYYTRPELVNELIKSALIPVIEERLKERAGNKDEQVRALLRLKVCDAAAGSGHMLLAAARTIAWYLARTQSGEENPARSIYQKCLREVIQHCIYGVDMNPDAVELCKLALWLEGHNSGKPLSFLDHKIRNGNSLVGVTDLSVLQRGIPDNAYNPVTGDDKEICKSLKKNNAAFNKTKQYSLFNQDDVSHDTEEFSNEYHELEEINQDNVQSVRQVKQKFESLRGNAKWWKDWRACNIWTSAFFFTYTGENVSAAPTSERLQQFLQNPEAAYGPMIGKALALSEEHRFFHWPLEFPDVFEQGGFDVVLGNPPWERIKLQQQEFFATRDVTVAGAANAAARTKLIKALPATNPALYKEYEDAVHTADSTGKFLRESGRCKLTAVGDINTYSIFSELSSSLINVKGRIGIIVPTGIATDDSNKAFFGTMVENNRLVSLFDFENREKIFKDVDSRYKFCLLTLSGKSIGNQKSSFGFFLTNIAHLQDQIRIFNLSKEDFLGLNPNTKTCPVFRTSIDANLSRKIYNQIGTFIDENKNHNPWGAYYIRLVDLGDHQKEIELTHLRNETVHIVPIYEAKLFWQMDHRFSTFANQTKEEIENGSAVQLSEHDKENSHNRVSVRYYSKTELRTELFAKYPDYSKNYFVLWRDISNATNERTSIAAVIPKVLASRSSPGIGFDGSQNSSLLVANLNSLVYDYFVRQKISGVHFNWGLLKQTPVISSAGYSKESRYRILQISSELIFTSWDIKAFADDVWKEAEEDLQEVIRQQWDENKAITGGHEWAPPEWCEIDSAGCPLPPFKWNDDRRTVLKAELDAIYAQLYGLTTEELRYILDPQDVYGPDFPGETFRVLKEKEIRLYGEYRTRRLVLEAWNKLNNINENVSLAPNIQTNMIDLSLHTGIYSIAETAIITGFSYQKVTSWFKELTKENYEGLDTKQARDVASGRISFHGLIELVVIGTLRENGLRMKKILQARSDLHVKTKKIYPFATNNVRERLNVSGRDIIWDFGDMKVTLDGSSQANIEFITQFFKDIVFANDVAQRLMPAKGNNKVIIDPKIGLGKPVIIEKEVPVDIVASSYNKNPKAISKIKAEFDLTEEEIMAAVAYMQ
jgi:uncharacterized protein (DUF433 family)